MSDGSPLHRKRRITSAALGSFAVVAAATLAFVKSLPVGGWAVVAVLGIAAGLVAAKELVSHREEQASEEKEREAALRCPPAAVRDVDPFSIGVTPSEIADQYRGASERPPYVSRDIDAELDRLLRDFPFVAIVGPSKAGKSRTAFEAIERLYPNWLLIAPEMPTLQREGSSGAVQAYVESAKSGAVIWLDDLQEFLRTKSIATQDLNAWRTAFPRVIVVATIRDGELASLRGSGLDVERIVDQAKIVPLPALPSTREMRAAQAVYPEEDFRDGIGVHLVAGQRLVERFVSAREANPLGFAIVAAAVDRRRCGLTSAASAEELLDLAVAYLHEVAPRSEFDRGAARTALKWAAEPVIQDIGLLVPKGESPQLYEPFEYVIAYRDGEVGNGAGRVPIPSTTWELLVRQSSGWDLRSIGFSAAQRRNLSLSVEALEKMAKDSDPHIQAHALSDLGDVWWEHGDMQRAAKQYKKAHALGYSCVSGHACYCIGLASDQEGEDPEPWYREVLKYPKSSAHPKALVNLGLQLRSKTAIHSFRTDSGVRFVRDSSVRQSPEDQRLEDEAESLFRRALESKDREAIGNGGNALGVMLASQDRVDEAEEVLRLGSEAGSRQATIRLAELLANQPARRTEGWGMLERLQKEDLEREDRCYLNAVWARIVEQEERFAEAISRLRDLAACDIPAYQEPAALNLARLLIKTDGAVEEARDLLSFVAAQDSPHAEIARKRLKDLGD